MPASIGVNLRVTGHCRQGGRKYMEDFFSVAYQQTEDEKDLEYAFFGIYDGHGGAEAAAFAKEHLMETIIKHKNFWSDNDEDVLRAIKDGYIATHYAMWKEQEKWPKTASGLPSTAGTTASVAFIRRGKIYIGHVGDSGIILGYQDPSSPEWKAMPLTRDHKPENADELSRIEQCGGKVVAKSGVPRVVWNRPKIGHQGPVRRSTPIDEIPFLAVARSLGDLWSYNSQINQFIVSPDPDCSVIPIDTNIHRCLIFGTDGLFNMLSPSMAVYVVQNAEIHNEFTALGDCTFKTWLNPSKLLVEKALQRWYTTKMRADNTSVVTLMLDPPGPPRAQVLKDRKKNAYPDRGLKIMTRYEDNIQENCSNCLRNSQNDSFADGASCNNTSLESVPSPSMISTSEENKVNNNNKDSQERNSPSSFVEHSSSVSSSDITSNYPLKERNFVVKPKESTSFDSRETRPDVDNDKENLKSSQSTDDSSIQIHEISSSSSDMDSCEEEDKVHDSTVSRHNLRSTRKPKCESSKINKVVVVDEICESKVKKVKRKLDVEEDDSPRQRKSIRIDHNQKKAMEVVENLKRSYPVTEVATRSSTSTNKMNLTQKILKSKKLNLKKRTSVMNKKLTKQKIKMVLEKVQMPTLPKKIGNRKSSVKTGTKRLLNISKSKVAKFQRGSRLAASQSQRRNAVSTNKTASQSRQSDLVKDGETKSIQKNERSTKVTLRNSAKVVRRSIRSSVVLAKGSNKNSPPAKPPQKPALPKISSVKVKTIRLKKKIQQKTANLRKSVRRHK